jgi:hypothetical protein
MRLSLVPIAAGLATTLLTSPNVVQAQEGTPAATASRETGRIFFLDLRGGRVLSATPDGGDLKVLATSQGRSPDGIDVDEAAGHVYWSTMGRAAANDGTIERVDIDGRNHTVLVAPGGLHTGKQMRLDKKNRKIYWSDREGMRVMRSNFDGSGIETLVVTGTTDEDRKDAKNWNVGLAIDVEGGHVYWTRKGGDNEGRGRILRAGLEIPRGQTAANRQDIETLFDNLPEPIDLELDLRDRMVYWTDRGDAPRGNTVNRAPMARPAAASPAARTGVQILVSGLREGIGIALDLEGNRMFFTDLGGTVYSAKLDGSAKKALLTGMGTLTGIAYVELPR